MLKSLLSIFFPTNCLCCAAPLLQQENNICLKCSADFGIFSDFKTPENEIEQLFWGKAQVYFATAPFLFLKGEHLQTIVHEFKYNHQKSLARQMGERLGAIINSIEHLQDVDAIAFVPMHKSKIKKRGYNQAKVLASGVSKVFNQPVVNALKRVKNTKTQTEKNVLERYKNSHHKFKGVSINQKHVLIIDDVITSGATLAACAEEIKSVNPNIKVSVACLAYRKIDV